MEICCLVKYRSSSRDPGLGDSLGMKYCPVHMGIIMHHDIRTPIKQPVFNGKS